VPPRGLPGNANLEQLRNGAGVSAVRIPRLLAGAVDDGGRPERVAWLEGLGGLVSELAAAWELEVGNPFEPGGRTAWVAPVQTAAGEEAVLKLAWTHWEADHEAQGLRAWDSRGTVRCLRSAVRAGTTILLLERCRPGHELGAIVAEHERDVVIAELLRRLWETPVAATAPFRPLQFMCDRWAASLERRFAADGRGLDPGLVRAGIAALRELPGSAARQVLLCTDLHAGNVLAAEREPWLVIDPKPFVGDPAYDTVQHMLNCDERLAADPAALARRMAGLLDLDAERVARWLFARCVQEAIDDVSFRAAAHRLASTLS
jgi:streptomycin 6-kinase